MRACVNFHTQSCLHISPTWVTQIEKTNCNATLIVRTACFATYISLVSNHRIKKKKKKLLYAKRGAKLGCCTCFSHILTNFCTIW